MREAFVCVSYRKAITLCVAYIPNILTDTAEDISRPDCGTLSDKTLSEKKKTLSGTYADLKRCLGAGLLLFSVILITFCAGFFSVHSDDISLLFLLIFFFCLIFLDYFRIMCCENDSKSSLVETQRNYDFIDLISVVYLFTDLGKNPSCLSPLSSKKRYSDVGRDHGGG